MKKVKKKKKCIFKYLKQINVIYNKYEDCQYGKIDRGLCVNHNK